MANFKRLPKHKFSQMVNKVPQKTTILMATQIFIDKMTGLPILRRT